MPGLLQAGEGGRGVAQLALHCGHGDQGLQVVQQVCLPQPLHPDEAQQNYRAGQQVSHQLLFMLVGISSPQPFY